MIIKSLFRSRYKLLKRINSRCSKHKLAVKTEDVVKYPPIIDASVPGILRDVRQQFYDRLKSLPTVEQKWLEMVSKHDYFSRVYAMGACSPTYLGVPFQHYITRTHFIKQLPETLNNFNVDDIYADIKATLYDEIQNCFSDMWQETPSKDWTNFSTTSSVGNIIVDSLLSACFKSLSIKNPHLLEVAIDQNPMVKSYWYHGGFKSPKNYIKDEDFFKVHTKLAERRIIMYNYQFNAENFCFQFNDYPYYTLRINEPLPPILPLDDALCSIAEVADYNYLPKNFGIPFLRKYYATVLPGSWPGDAAEFPFLQIYTLDKMAELLPKLKYHNVQDIENGLAVMASFGWLNGLASFQGFTPYHDLTYPIVGQTILTNGNEWGFYIYQLNSICFHADVDNKDRRNLCWFSGKMNLFETIEGGKPKGINDDVLKTLLMFMLHRPQRSPNFDLKPYLGDDTRTEEEKKTMRESLKKFYRNVINPNYAHVHEVPMWHHVYKRHKLAPPSPSVRLR